MRQAEKIVCLRVIDSLWMEHLENMEYLRDSVRLRAYGQQDPLIEYKNEGHKMFQQLVAEIDAAIANTIMKAQLAGQSGFATQQPPYAGTPAAARPMNRGKIGRNDPCPCGAVKPETGEVYKYKRCGLINAPYHKKS